MNETVLQDFEDPIFVIVFMILSILSVKKFIKSLLLNCKGTFSLNKLCSLSHFSSITISVSLAATCR